MSEFDLIRRHFSRPVPAGVLGAGDDCALLPVPAGAVAVSTDLLLEGRHFFADVAPAHLGHKALAVNLSDLAAMGARPLGATLGLALPERQESWLEAFADGWYALAERWRCPLVGGDTTRSATGIVIAVTVMGQVDARRALRRDAARPGHDIWVSGTLGEAHVALQLARARRCCLSVPPASPVQQWAANLSPAELGDWYGRLVAAMELPEPRVDLGLALAGTADAAIDLSDGLVQDLGHVLRASGVGAELLVAALPAGRLADLPCEVWQHAALAGGDDYELCFTALPAHRPALQAISQRLRIPLTRIGRVREAAGLDVIDTDNRPLAGLPGGFDHFSS